MRATEAGESGRHLGDEMPNCGLTVVLPAFNEEARLASALDELFGYLRRHGDQGRDGAPGAARLPDDVRVLVVDDGSKDGTAALVSARPEKRELTPTGAPLLDLLTVQHGGKGAAVRAGMLAVETELAVFADADMATPPDQLPLLVEALRKHDVALGSRIQPDGSDMRRTQPGFRRFLGRAFHGLASIWAVGDVQDTQCGFKGFTREAAHDLFARQQVTSIVFDVELIYLARRRGYRIAVVPIRWSDKRGSRMHPGPRLGMRVAWDLFRIPLLHRRVGRRLTERGRGGTRARSRCRSGLGPPDAPLLSGPRWPPRSAPCRPRPATRSATTSRRTRAPRIACSPESPSTIRPSTWLAGSRSSCTHPRSSSR